MSALPPKADKQTKSRFVRFVPEADICTAAKKPLFDHLVAADKANKGQRRAGSMTAASFAGSPDKSLGLTSLFAM
jgi:hypothetical protein